MTRLWLVIRHAMPMMLAQLIPLAASFVIVSLALGVGRDDFVTVTGISATVAGLGMLINVGVGVATLRDLAAARGDTTKLRAALAWNLRVASATSVIALSVSLAAAIVLWVVLPAGSPARIGVVVAFALQVPSILIGPQTSVLASTFQHLDREKENLSITATRTAIALAVGVGVVLFVEDDVLAIGLQAVVGTVMAAAMLGERWRRLTRSGLRARVLGVPVFSRSLIMDRVLNSLDGAVFMLLFLFAQVIAASISIEVGAQVAAAVALCRTVIIPLKMIGLTAGRMGLREPEAQSGYAIATMLATAVMVIPCALVLVVLDRAGAGPLSGTLLTVLVATQLLLEPWAGPLFAFLKVSYGARAGLAGLLVSYLIVAPILLLMCRTIAPTAAGIWLCLLAVRALFAATSVLALRRGLRESRDSLVRTSAGR